MIKDGWHTLCGYRVYVEDGFVRYGVTGEGVRYHKVYVYKYYKRIGWLLSPIVTVSAFRHGVDRGTIKMQ